MPRIALVVVALTLSVPAMYPAAEACGDKFLAVGRGAKFQRAWASVYPGKLLIYSRPSSDPKNAIRDPQLHKALRQAGHNVNVIEDWTLFEQALRTVSVDVVLVDVSEASRLQGLISSSPGRPDALYVALPKDVKPATPPQVVSKLKSSDGALKYLEEIESVMKARSKHAKNS